MWIEFDNDPLIVRKWHAPVVGCVDGTVSANLPGACGLGRLRVSFIRRSKGATGELGWYAAVVGLS